VDMFMVYTSGHIVLERNYGNNKTTMSGYLCGKKWGGKIDPRWLDVAMLLVYSHRWTNVTLEAVGCGSCRAAAEMITAHE